MLYAVTDIESGRVLAVFGDPYEARRMTRVLSEGAPAEADALRVVGVDERGKRVDADDVAKGRCRCCP